jgi:hypothetical protein
VVGGVWECEVGLGGGLFEAGVAGQRRLQG